MENKNLKSETENGQPQNSKGLGLVTRGRTLVGTVISARAQKTVTVQWYRWEFLKKYDRYVKRKSTVKAHSPDSLNSTIGDIVVVQECRPLSKTKKFLVIEKRGRDFAYLTSQDQLQEAAAVRDAKARKIVEDEETEKSKSVPASSKMKTHVSSPKSEVSSEVDS
nr:30S ribosomal protein S17P [uncultured archaeon]